jgi:hypothetical protein
MKMEDAQSSSVPFSMVAYCPRHTAIRAWARANTRARATMGHHRAIRLDEEAGGEEGEGGGEERASELEGGGGGEGSDSEGSEGGSPSRAPSAAPTSGGAAVDEESTLVSPTASSAGSAGVANAP